MTAPQIIEYVVDPDDIVSLEFRLPRALYGLITEHDPGSTYALLDTAAWSEWGADLEDDLAATGLEPRSLLQGAAEQEFAKVAPVLIPLDVTTERASDFLKTLLRDRWAACPGLLIQSRQSLETVRAACRKGVRLRDGDSSWYYNRYWEPEFFLYLALMAGETAFFHHFDGVDRFLLPIAGSAVAVVPDFRDGPRVTDAEAQADLIFEAGQAMVANRHLRDLTAQTPRGLGANQLYDLWRDAFGHMALDYDMLKRSVDIVYTLSFFYREALTDYLNDDMIASLTDAETGRQSDRFLLLFGLCEFARLNGIRPDRLWMERGVTFWQDQRHP